MYMKHKLISFVELGSILHLFHRLYTNLTKCKKVQSETFKIPDISEKLYLNLFSFITLVITPGFEAITPVSFQILVICPISYFLYPLARNLSVSLICFKVLVLFASCPVMQGSLRQPHLRL